MFSDEVKLMQGDCLKRMQELEVDSIDFVLTDPPYGTTACKWDSIIPFEPMWEQLNKIAKSNGAIVLFGREPFSSTLRMSNIKNYRYDWIWEKTKPQRHTMAKKMPLTIHEQILVFYEKQPTYNPQMKEGKPYTTKHRKSSAGIGMGQDKRTGQVSVNNGDRFPVDVLNFSNGNNKITHPTQKPIALMEYLVRTYTDKGDTILDFTMGSGTTGVACVRTGRQFIGIELDEYYYNLAYKRIKSAYKNRGFLPEFEK